MDPLTGECYCLVNASGRVKYWPGTGTTWSELTAASGGFTIADALEWWPDANNGDGGLLFYSRWGNSGTLKLSNAAVSSWNNNFNLSSFASGAGSDVHVASLWLPSQRQIMVGVGVGGRRKFIQVNQDGSLTAKTDIQQDWGPGFEGSNGAIVAFGNGRVFHLALDNDVLYEYLSDSDSWVSRGSFVGGSGQPTSIFWHFACAIDSADCIYLAVQSSTSLSTVQEFLYKI
jgi:hypothetical protein